MLTGGYITLKDGQTLEYDWLVLALGAETATFGIPGVRELALPFCNFDDAVRVRASDSPADAGCSSTVLAANACCVMLAVLLWRARHTRFVASASYQGGLSLGCSRVFATLNSVLECSLMFLLLH